MKKKTQISMLCQMWLHIRYFFTCRSQSMSMTKKI